MCLHQGYRFQNDFQSNLGCGLFYLLMYDHMLAIESSLMCSHIFVMCMSVFLTSTEWFVCRSKYLLLSVFVNVFCLWFQSSWPVLILQGDLNWEYFYLCVWIIAICVLHEKKNTSRDLFFHLCFLFKNNFHWCYFENLCTFYFC